MTRDQMVSTDSDEIRTFADAHRAKTRTDATTLGDLYKALSEASEMLDRTAGRLEGLAGAEIGARSLRLQKYADDCRKCVVQVSVRRGKKVGF